LCRFLVFEKGPLGPEIIHRALEPNPPIPDELFTGGLQVPRSKTPPAMYFERSAFFMARSPTREDVPDQVAVL
jgi:hypothetical protein